MEFGSVLILFFSAIGGGLLAFLLQGKFKLDIKLILAFGAAYLMGLICLHLLPEVFHSDLENAGLYILIGFVLQILLEFLSNGIEHGHAHGPTTIKKNFPIVLMFSLGIHSLIEGMPFGEHGHHHHNHSLLFGIVIHKVPVAFVLGSFLLNSGMSWLKSAFWLGVFAIMSPLGAFIHHNVSLKFLNDVQNLIPIVLCLLVGILMHVATTIIFESSDGHKFNISKLTVIFLGILTAYLFL